MLSDKKLSIIIVSYNNRDVLFDCLDSIEAYNDIDDGLEVIVVEQSPSNDLYEELRNKYPNSIILRNENLGFGGGNNVGFRASSGKYVLFLNPDTRLIEPIASFAIKAFEDNPSLGLFGVRLLDDEMDNNQSFQYIDCFGIIQGIRWRRADSTNKFDSSNMYITGADMFVRRSAFEEAGCFDENFFMYCEESDLCNRIKKLGYGISFYPEKRIVHLEGKSSSGGLSTFGYEIDSHCYYAEKYNQDKIKILKKWRRFLKFMTLSSGNNDSVNQKIKALNKRISEINNE